MNHALFPIKIPQKGVESTLRSHPRGDEERNNGWGFRRQIFCQTVRISVSALFSLPAVFSNDIVWVFSIRHIGPLRSTSPHPRVPSTAIWTGPNNICWMVLRREVTVKLRDSRLTLVGVGHSYDLQLPRTST